MPCSSYTLSPVGRRRIRHGSRRPVTVVAVASSRARTLYRARRVGSQSLKYPYRHSARNVCDVLSPTVCPLGRGTTNVSRRIRPAARKSSHRPVGRVEPVHRDGALPQSSRHSLQARQDWALEASSWPTFGQPRSRLSRCKGPTRWMVGCAASRLAGTSASTSRRSGSRVHQPLARSSARSAPCPAAEAPEAGRPSANHRPSASALQVPRPFERLHRVQRNME